MKKLKAETILLARSLNELAHFEHYRTDPVARLVRLLIFVKVKRARSELAKVLVPLFERRANLQPVRHDDNSWILNCGDDLIGELLLLPAVVLSAVLVRCLCTVGWVCLARKDRVLITLTGSMVSTCRVRVKLCVINKI